MGDEVGRLLWAEAGDRGDFFDRRRREVLPELIRWFVSHGVIPLGRYGTWDYLAMEDSLRHGREVAQWIAGEER